MEQTLGYLNHGLNKNAPAEIRDLNFDVKYI